MCALQKLINCYYHSNWQNVVSLQYNMGCHPWVQVPLGLHLHFEGVHLRLAIEGKNLFILLTSKYLYIYQ